MPQFNGKQGAGPSHGTSQPALPPQR